MKPLKEKHKTPKQTTNLYDYIECDTDIYGHYYDDYFDYDDDYYDYTDDGVDYSVKWYFYAYIKSLDKFVTDDSRIKNLDNDYGQSGYEVYTDEDEIIHPEVYTHVSNRKMDAFFGCVVKAMSRAENPSEKLKQICDTLMDKYPEIYFKLMGKFEDS